MIIRKATARDLDSAAEIYDMARDFMRKNGNPNQWPGNYPGKAEILSGIESGTSYVCENEGEVVASFHFEPIADDPTYRKIYDGEWKNSENYGVIHRIAVKYHGKGIIDFCFEHCFEIAKNLKIDTHRDNLPMIRCLKRCGFEYCGIIYLANGDERVAFQKTK